jgi:hypothetical protein
MKIRFKTKLSVFVLLVTLHMVCKIPCDCSDVFCSKDVISDKSTILTGKP